MGNRLPSLLRRAAALESKTDREKINMLFELCEVLDPSHVTRNQTRSQVVLRDSAVMHALISLCNADENPAEVVTYVLYVLARLAFADANARTLVQTYPQVVKAVLDSADKTTEVKVLGVLRNVVSNLDNAAELTVALTPLLLGSLESDSEEAQVRGLVVWQILANGKINAWELLLGLVPLFDDALHSEQVQVEALRVLGNLTAKNQQEMAENHATLVPLLVRKLTSNSQSVRLEALHVLLGLLRGNNLVGDTILVEHAALMPALLHQMKSRVEAVRVEASHVLTALAHE